LGRTLDQNISNLRNHFALTADQAAAMRTQHVHWFTDLVFGRDATAVHTLLTGRTLSPLTEEEQRDLTAKTMEQTRGLYGEDTDRLIAKAKALIDSKPGLGDAIAAAGIGNHPLSYCRFSSGCADELALGPPGLARRQARVGGPAEGRALARPAKSLNPYTVP